uniref:Multifunctional conjugation protein TraI n=1 Tax=Klebsiella pneumoniae TaxID=573 RepID=A0A2P1BPW0_KLEPN|nr:Multifunctional conjugation protein TraI [Klebsiella pneumoniae]
MTQRELDNATLNQLAQSGSHLRLYSAQDAARTTEKLSRHTSFSVVSEQLKTRSGETDRMRPLRSRRPDCVPRQNRPFTGHPAA